MNIGFVTGCWNGHARFLVNWCKAIANLDVKPNAVTVILSDDHGLTEPERLQCEDLIPNINILYVSGVKSALMLRDIGAAFTDTEWIMAYDIDDEIMPGTIEALSKVEKDADYICIGWRVEEEGKEPIVRTSSTPLEMSKKARGKGIIWNSSPYRKSLWTIANRAAKDEYIFPFLSRAVVSGARFKSVNHSCIKYIRRPDSYSRTTFTIPAVRKVAVDGQQEMYKVIDNYYRKKA